VISRFYEKAHYSILGGGDGHGIGLHRLLRGKRETSVVLGRVDFAKICMDYDHQVKNGLDTIQVTADPLGFDLQCPEGGHISMCRLTLKPQITD
jgi:hypothetical protein